MKQRVCLGLALLFSVAAGADAPPGTPPKVISMVAPKYPVALRLNGTRGEVLMEFTVDAAGEVCELVIVKSTHPEFEPSAIEALLQWKFEPALVNGQPVNMRLQRPIRFELKDDDGIEVGVDAFKVPSKPPKEAPPALQYDQPPKPVLTSAPVYPFELLEQKIKGSATIVFVIDPAGHTRQVIVREASRPEFGAAAAAMISAWEFEPARKNGQPCWAMLSKKQIFDRADRDSPVNESAERLLKARKKDPASVLADLRQLDRVPKARYQPSPVLPDAMREKPVVAEAEIEFIIDRTGRAQLPRVRSATREDFGWAAATAVARWIFAPPTKNGKPVDVKVVVPVAYEPSSEAGPPPPDVPPDVKA